MAFVVVNVLGEHALPVGRLLGALVLGLLSAGLVVGLVLAAFGRVEIDSATQTVSVCNPFRSHLLKWSEIEAVKLGDAYYVGATLPVPVIVTTDGRKIKCHALSGRVKRWGSASQFVDQLKRLLGLG